MSFWIELLVSAFLVVGSVFALVGAIVAAFLTGGVWMPRPK